MLSKGGFTLTKFVSNVPNLSNRVDPKIELGTKTDEKLLAAEDQISHVLGSKWNHRFEVLVVSRGTSPALNRPVTQRVVLSLVSAVYDPIGLVAPYTVTARLFLKDIWRLSGQQWNNNLPEDICKKFLDWVEELPTLSTITIPRCYFQGNIETTEFNIFGDSSQNAFSAVAYLCAKVNNDKGMTTELAFVFGKARAAPMKALTVPKLELQAALLAARLKDEVQKALIRTVERTLLWTDSTTVLQWLHSIDKQPVFVANRVAEILELTTVDEWNHVPTVDNPADAGTRGMSAKALLESSMLKGPAFLRTSDWPFQPSDEISMSKIKKLYADKVPTETKCQETVVNTANVVFNAVTLEWQKYSSYEKLLRTLAYILRLLPNIFNTRTKTGLITDPAETQIAEQKFIYLVQSESFPNEKKSLLKCLAISTPSAIKDFSPFIGRNGLLRAQGRTKQLEVANFDVNHPILHLA